MLEILSFVDHKLAVFTYFKRNFSLHTSQHCNQQKLSNLACLVKLKDWTQKWDNVCDCDRSGQQTSEVQKIHV